MRLLSPACRTARLLHAGRPVSSIDASSASKASALVRRSLAAVKQHIPPIVFSIVYRFRTPSVEHDAVVVSACRTARFLHAGRPVTRSASFHDIRRREIAPADYPRSVSFLPVLHARPRSAVMLRLPLAGCACLACRTARLACRTARRSDAAAPLAVGHSSKSCSYVNRAGARPSLMCWIFSLQLFRSLSTIAFVRMPDGPPFACRTAHRLRWIQADS
jgi:hypothetical protein